MKLSNAQRNFCQLVVDERSQAEAYLQAFPNSKSRNGAGASATRLLRKANVQEEIERIRADMETEKELTRSKVRELLYKIVMDGTARGSVVLRAIAEDNKIMGRYRQKKEPEMDPWAEFLSSIRNGEKFES